VATDKITYAASGAITNATASLATSAGLTAGYESATLDNSTNLYKDYAISGIVTTGTSPTAGVIEIWCIPEKDDSTWPNVFDGTTGAETVTSRDILMACGFLCVSIATSTTSDQVYPWNRQSLSAICGNTPRKCVFFTVHNTAVNLNATGSNHELFARGTYDTIA
jgi:hypothetical protein